MRDRSFDGVDVERPRYRLRLVSIDVESIDSGGVMEESRSNGVYGGGPSDADSPTGRGGTLSGPMPVPR